MDWFRRGPPKKRERAPAPATVVDPVFGPVLPDNEGAWIGDRVELRPGLPPVGISVPGDDSGPSPAAREAYLELRRRYPELAPCMAEGLFGRSNAGYRRYGVNGPDSLWPHARLRHVHVFDDGPLPRLELGYDLPWGGGHDYDVLIEGWRVVSVSCNG